jgi:hydroxymethylbilane synthase
MAQSRYVADLITRLRPDCQIEIVTVHTKGDQDRSVPLWKLEGTGFFTTQIEESLLEGSADIAVHSFKDLPTCCSEGLTVAAVCDRRFVEDVLAAGTGVRSIMDLPAGAKVGTSSLRRIAQVRRLRPDLETVTIRGNVPTRIEKVGSEVDAVVVARAGLERLGLMAHVSQIFDPMEFIPAPAQGALAVEARIDDDEVCTLLSFIDDRTARCACQTERALLAALEGGCHAPIGAYARIEGQRMRLRACISDLEGERYIADEISGLDSQGPALAAALAARMFAAGASAILEELKP